MPKPSLRTNVSNVSGNAEAIPLATSAVTVLTGGTSLKDADGTSSEYGGNLMRVTVNNSGASVRRVKLYLIRSGGSLAEKYKFFDESIPPDAQPVIWSPRVPMKYKDSAIVQGTQDAGTDVLVFAEAIEFF